MVAPLVPVAGGFLTQLLANPAACAVGGTALGILGSRTYDNHKEKTKTNEKRYEEHLDLVKALRAEARLTNNCLTSMSGQSPGNYIDASYESEPFIDAMGNLVRRRVANAISPDPNPTGPGTNVYQMAERRYLEDKKSHEADLERKAEAKRERERQDRSDRLLEGLAGMILAQQQGGGTQKDVPITAEQKAEAKKERERQERSDSLLEGLAGMVLAQQKEQGKVRYEEAASIPRPLNAEQAINDNQKLDFILDKVNSLAERLSNVEGTVANPKTATG